MCGTSGSEAHQGDIAEWKEGASPSESGPGSQHCPALRVTCVE